MINRIKSIKNKLIWRFKWKKRIVFLKCRFNTKKKKIQNLKIQSWHNEIWYNLYRRYMCVVGSICKHLYYIHSFTYISISTSFIHLQLLLLLLFFSLFRLGINSFSRKIFAVFFIQFSSSGVCWCDSFFFVFFW